MVNWRAVSGLALSLLAALWIAGCGGRPGSTGGLAQVPDPLQDEPAPAGVIPAVPEDRASSETPPGDPEQRVVLGSEYLAMHNGTVDGTALILDAPENPGGDLAWGIYRFSYLHGYIPLTLAIETTPLEFYDQYWVGVANYTTGGWEWFGPATLPEYEVDLSESEDRYISNLGNFYFILLAEPGNGIRHIQTTLSCVPDADYDPPGAPANLAASDGDFDDRVRATWDASAGALGYWLWRTVSLEGGGPDEDAWQSLGTMPYTVYDDYTVVPGDVYYYKVRAYNHGGYSEFSNVDSGYASAPPPPPPPASGYIIGKVTPIGEDFDNMTGYLAGLPDVITAPLNVYGVFVFTDLPWGTYLVTVHHPQRDFSPEYAQVTISPDEPYAIVEFAAAETSDFGQLAGYTWRYDPATGYDGIYGTNVLIEQMGFEDSWTRITNGYGWFGIGGLETSRYYRVTPTRADMLFTPDSRVVFLGGSAKAEPLFFRVLEQE